MPPFATVWLTDVFLNVFGKQWIYRCTLKQTDAKVVPNVCWQRGIASVLNQQIFRVKCGISNETTVAFTQYKIVLFGFYNQNLYCLNVMECSHSLMDNFQISHTHQHRDRNWVGVESLHVESL